MKNAEISRQVQSLKALMKKATASTKDVELLSHWARYFCVRTAGIIENGIAEIYSEFAKRTSVRQVGSYAASRLKKIQNPNAEKITIVARSFDARWASALEKYLEENGRKDAIDSVMNNRNQIAHGKDVGITIPRISEYLEKSVEVLEFIESQVRPD
jgi:RiboL-PSP-HEPN